jgi:hypothetical protein
MFGFIFFQNKSLKILRDSPATQRSETVGMKKTKNKKLTGKIEQRKMTV